MIESANIARHLPLMAARAPDRPAVKIPRGRTGAGDIDYLTLSFAELDAEVDAWVNRLATAGVQRGDRVLVMVRQGLPLIAAAFALFKHGAVPVIIDPGMGRKSFLACVARTRPTALLGIPLAQLLSHLFRGTFGSVRQRLWVSGSPTARLSHRQLSTGNREPVASTAGDLAAILFTSGSTGAPKGVRYEHGMFEAQVRLVRETYRIEPGEIDLPMLPIFALFNPALGMTTIVPELDPSRPATVDPAKIVQAIRQENVTNSFGSPTLWRKIAAHCRSHSLTLPSLRRVLMAGAPVPPALFADVQSILPNGTAHSPYGATEALPVASISAAEIFGDRNGEASSNRCQDESSRTMESSAIGSLGPCPLILGTSGPAAGAGTCLGTPVTGIEIKIIAPSDTPIPSLAGARELPAGEIGEIIVSGPVVTREYDQLPEATALAKIAAGLDTSSLDLGTSAPPDGAVWHRLGDVGYLDADGRLWFCGRKAERVMTSAGPLHTEQVEPIFNQHPLVERSALVGLGAPGAQEPAVVIQRRALHAHPPQDDAALARELFALAAPHAAAARVRRILFHPAFPVDVRHNAKIHRLALARWAASRPGFQPDGRTNAARSTEA